MSRLVVRPPGPEGRFKKQWRWDPQRRRLENAEHGAAIQVIDAVNADSGEVAYEGIVIESRRCELHIPVRRDDMSIGFVFHRRFSVIPPEISTREFAADPGQILSVIQFGTGIEEYEACHGLAISRLEEVLQEIGCKVAGFERIGCVKESPPLGGIGHEFFAVEVNREPSGEILEANEEISHVKFFPAREVRNIQTMCGLTQAALWRFRVWGLGQDKGSLWREVASEL